MGRLESLGGHAVHSPFQGNISLCEFATGLNGCNAHLAPSRGHLRLWQISFPAFLFPSILMVQAVAAPKYLIADVGYFNSNIINYEF